MVNDFGMFGYVWLKYDGVAFETFLCIYEMVSVM